MGVMEIEEQCEKVVEVRMVCNRVMTVVIFFEEDVLRLICGYAPQGGRHLEEKQSFCDELKGEWEMHRAGDLVTCLGDITRHIDVFDMVDGGYGIGKKNLEGRMLLELSGEGIMCVKYMA